MTESGSTPQSFSEFWPAYVLAHRRAVTRGFHLAGSLGGWGLLLTAIVRLEPWLIVAALAVPYALAWSSHFFVEHNRPATFEHPLWSWVADQKMVALMLTGKIDEEVRRCEQRVA